MSTKFIAYNNRDGFAGTSKPRCQMESRLAHPANDCAEALHVRDTDSSVHDLLNQPNIDQARIAMTNLPDERGDQYRTVG
jgi:hypothetical protein